MKQKEKYKAPITIVFPGMVARVYFPILDLKEKEKRMENIYKASAQIIEGVKK